MKESTVTLTKTDQLILESYKHLLDGLSDYMGAGYELVLHSLESFEHSVIKIINGFHTGREEGAPITNLALNMLEKIRTCDGVDHVSYFAKNKQGEDLKSSTIAIRGEENRVIGLLCINFYMNTSIFEIISAYVPNSALEPVYSEHFGSDSEELIRSAVLRVRNEVQEDPRIPTALKNREIISRLNSQGFFKFKDAVVKTASILCISKNTVYMHLRNQAE